jgi:hypothetical protein
VNHFWEKAKLSGSALMKTLDEVHGDLHSWDKNILKSPKKRIENLKNDLEELMGGPMMDEAIYSQRDISLTLENLFEQEGIVW